MIYNRSDFMPRTRLSAAAMVAEFQLPDNNLRPVIAGHFDMVWGTIAGECAPRIWHGAVHHVGMRPATLEEIDNYLATR